ncbi:M23 family metallopeptidase [Bacillus spizizenii]|nr:M23 family metallopeptidase [Bacillus spizizenii]
MSFQVSYNGSRTVIEKEPLKQTPAEPIYPDLLEIFIDIPDDVEVIDEIDEDERLANEKEGYSMSFSFEELIRKGIDVTKIFFNYEDYKRRQAVFDVNEHRHEVKEVNDGKPFNNNDPYPIDEKIEELEQHVPLMKIHAMELDDPSPALVEVTKALMDLSDKAEKRIVQLENILATVVRNLFRVGSRMHINCVYYGGQSNYRKYNTIRCLHHDRIADGQLMTLDQCLACTRYEPIIGQVYDILDESGQSLDVILDDNQMSYSTMQDHIKFARAEEYHEPEEKVLMKTKGLDKRDEEEVDFPDVWDEGFVMDWNLVPVEEQMFHVNYEDGSKSKQLPSNYNTIAHLYTDNGFYTSLEGDKATMEAIKRNDEAFGKVFDEKLLGYIKNGESYAKNNVDNALKRMTEGGYENVLQEVCKKEGVDPLLIMSIIVIESGGQISLDNDASTSYRGLMQVDKNNLSANWMSLPDTQKAKENIEVGVKMYKGKLKAAWGTTNPVLGTTGYNSGEGILLGISSRGVPAVHSPGLNSSEHNTWTWVDIAKNLERNVSSFYGQGAVKEKLTYYPRIHFVYKLLVEKKGFNPLSGDSGLQFPYSPETIKSKPIYFTSDFGMRYHTKKNEYIMHCGLDFHSGAGTPIVAAGDGKVIKVDWQPNGAGRYITIDHGNNTYTLYMHLQKDSPSQAGISVGKRVKAGQVIGKEGNTGLNMGATGVHVHFEVRIGGNESKYAVDPKKDIFPWMAGMKKDSNNPIKFPI